jgi:hypothetical protein
MEIHVIKEGIDAIAGMMIVLSPQSNYGKELKKYFRRKRIMNTKVLVLSIVAVLLVSITFLTGEQASNEVKKSGVTLFMDGQKDRLMIVGENDNSPVMKIERIMFNGKDYTEYAKELISSYPTSFASGKMLIFGNEGAALKGNQWKCPKGIIFIPGEKEIIIAHASDIRYNQMAQTVAAKEVSMLKSYLGKEEKEEKKLDHMTLDLSSKTIRTGITLLMDARKNSLTILGEDDNFREKKIERIMYNGKDYTEYATELISSQPMSFASSKMLIFGNEGVVGRGNEWKCPKGIIFIPGEKELIIAHASDITYNEKAQTVNAKEVSMLKSYLGKEEKEEKKLDQMTLDLTWRKK